MSDDECDEYLPSDWQLIIDPDGGICYNNLKTGLIVSRHPITGTRRFAPPMPEGWYRSVDCRGRRLFTNIKTGARSRVDPRLALPLLKYPGGVPVCRSRFDGLSKASEVLDDCDVAGKHIVIVGGTGACGSFLARALAIRGAQVLVLSRNPPKWKHTASSQHVPNGLPMWAHVDLANFSSIHAFLKVFTPSSKIDSLILAPSTLPEKACFQSTVDGFDRTIQVNFLSQVLLIRYLLPRLCGNPNSTIVFVSCESFRVTNITSPDGVFPALDSASYDLNTTSGRVYLHANSKALQLLFATALRRHMQKLKIQSPRVYTCHPGRLLWNSKHIQNASWHCWWWLKCACHLAYPFTKSMDCAASTIAFCSLHPAAKSLQAKGEEGVYFSGCSPVEIPESLRDPRIADVTWLKANSLLEESTDFPPEMATFDFINR